MLGAAKHLLFLIENKQKAESFAPLNMTCSEVFLQPSSISMDTGTVKSLNRKILQSVLASSLCHHLELRQSTQGPDPAFDGNRLKQPADCILPLSA